MTHSPNNRSPASGFRPDVEGLRAIAVIMVLLYHFDVRWASGGFAGVDVFFVISGYLITGLLAKEVANTGRVSLVDFYARRAKRLFPAAALVLVSTAAATMSLLPRTRWQDIGGDIVASAAYFINWRLASRSVDYLAEDVAPSPVQHFWSLAVEEQYYIVWPLLLVTVLWLFRTRIRIRTTTLLLGVTAAVGLPSLVYSIMHTTSSPATAYFLTTTRMWELAIGGAVALLAPQLSRIPALLAQTIGWVGIVGLVSTLFLVSTSTPWPSYSAALPTIATAAVIAAGFSAGARGPVVLLGNRFMCWIGGISYSLYLWHWPIIQFAKAHWGNDLSLAIAFGAATLSIILAWLTLRWVENPIRFSESMHRNPLYALSTGINFSLLGIALGLGLISAVSLAPRNANPAGPLSSMATPNESDHTPGARLLKTDSAGDPALQPVDSFPAIIPAPERAVSDVPQAYADGCQMDFAQSKPREDCYYGKPDGKTRIAVVGDSKMVQWLPALERLAVLHDWNLVVYAKSSCAFHGLQSKLKGEPYLSCTEWNESVVDILLGPQKPDIVITSTGSGLRSENESEVTAWKDRWTLLTNNGIKVVAIANNPNPGRNIYECVAMNPSRLKECSFPRRPGPGTPSMQAAARDMSGVGFIDMNDSICSETLCPAVVGGVLIYRQGSHLTRTYVESLTARLERELQRIEIVRDLQAQH